MSSADGIGSTCLIAERIILEVEEILGVECLVGEESPDASLKIKAIRCLRDRLLPVIFIGLRECKLIVDQLISPSYKPEVFEGLNMEYRVFYIKKLVYEGE